MRSLCLALALPILCFSQAQPVNQVTGPSPDANVRQYFYSGSNLAYVCQAPQNSFSNANRWSVALGNLTNIVVLTNTGTINFTGTSYYWVGMTITVSGSATTALNATYTVTAVSGSTATITTSGVSNATYTDMLITTLNPVLNQAAWAIHAYKYDGSNNLIGDFWANSLGQPNANLACSTRANY